MRPVSLGSGFGPRLPATSEDESSKAFHHEHVVPGRTGAFRMAPEGGRIVWIAPWGPARSPALRLNQVHGKKPRVRSLQDSPWAS